MIYLDNAATSFPKPLATQREVLRCISTYCGNPGRSGHALSLAAANKIYECRTELAELFSLSDPLGIVFTQNTTHALNLVLKGLLSEGDHVIISDMEHNSVLRPLVRMAKNGLIEYSIFKSRTLEKNQNPSLVCASIARLLRKNTRAVICAHASNICSATLPISEIGSFCKRHGLYFIVDAAQSAGHLSIDTEKMKIDALCAPAHKALYGIQGCGFAALSPSLSSKLSTLCEGGNGLNSFDPEMPDESPERYEAGTLPTPAIAGLLEGVRHVRQLGIEAIHAHECELFCYARELLLNTKGITLYAPDRIGSVLLFNKEGVPSEELARKLADNGICVRGGYHCAPLAHTTLGTEKGGAVRLSFGIFNTRAELEKVARIVSNV